MAVEPDQNDAGNDEGVDLKWVDLPMKAPVHVAVEIMEDLRAGKSVETEFDSDAAPDLADTIQWQIDNEQRATEYVEEYDDE